LKALVNEVEMSERSERIFPRVNMLPIFTTTQVKDGIDSGDLMLDLSDYMKKKDAATKTDINALTAALAGKLDATPQHKHQIDDIKQLQNALDGKLDKGERYSHSMILSDVEKISYLEAPRVGKLDICGYVFYVDEANGDLMITLNDVLIGSYSIASGKWSFESDGTKINTIQSALNEYIAKTDAVLKNHYDAILLLCQKHGMVDGDGSDGDKVTPTNV
jgi:hypothetical protein